MDDATTTLTREWFEKAAEDFAAAAVLFERNLTTPAGFHCQQTAEKLIKGYLLLNEQDIPKTHDIVRLIDLARPFDPSWADWTSFGTVLSQYAVEARYPGAGSEHLENAQDFLTQTASLVQFVSKRVPVAVIDGLKWPQLP